jgi:hypothetical protein
MRRAVIKGEIFNVPRLTFNAQFVIPCWGRIAGKIERACDPNRLGVREKHLISNVRRLFFGPETALKHRLSLNLGGEACA